MTDRIDIKYKSQLYHYVAHVTAVYDGDTITVDIDLGMGMWLHAQRVRFWKVNTPEVTGSEKEWGLQVRDYVRGLILDKDILLRTILDKRGEDRTGKFGRLLGEILVTPDDGEVVNVNELLLAKGFAVPMDDKGSAVRTRSVTSQNSQQLPERISCPYCGEHRTVDGVTSMVTTCPNCLDQPYRFGD